MKYKVGDIVRYKDLYGTFKIIKCDEELGQYVAVEVKEVGSRIFNEWEEKNMVLEVLVDSSTKKLKLIDILNKIANGELKEGTQLKWKDKKYWKDKEYILIDGIFTRYIEFPNARSFLLEDMGALYRTDTEWLNDEVELIEPDHFPDVGKMSEPTDNTKIEELELGNTYLQDAIIQLTDKLNEVIRHINK